MIVRLVLSACLVLGALARPAASQVASSVAPGATEADVRFMQAMIPHHAQALDMAALVAERTDRRDLRLVAERIRVSQTDEIAWMTQWLHDHGAEVPGAHAHHGGHGDHAMMPGMLTPDQMARLAASTGPAFERLFLSGMIQHHQGALGMVAELFATPGAAQATGVFRFAADVEADQQAEIGRMRLLLGRLLFPPPPRP